MPHKSHILPYFFHSTIVLHFVLYPYLIHAISVCKYGSEKLVLTMKGTIFTTYGLVLQNVWPIKVENIAIIYIRTQ